MADEVQATQPTGSKSSTWLWIAVIVLVLLGGYYVFTRQAQAPVTTDSPEAIVEPPDESLEETVETGEVMEKESVEVVYQDGAFNPDTVTVQVGTPVRFVNGGDDEMWVASAPHPEHTDYPGFDQGEAVGNGGEYTFTFDNPGSWNYHNHENPTAFGTVVVEE